MQLKKHFVYSMTIILIAFLGIVPGIIDNAWSHGDLTGKGYQEPEKRGPNGGKLIELEGGLMEIVVSDQIGEIALIMLDKDLNPIPVADDMTALGYLRMPENTVKWFDFERGYRDQVVYLYASTGIENIGPFNAVIRLNIGDERKNYRFSWSPLAHGHNE